MQLSRDIKPKYHLPHTFIFLKSEMKKKSWSSEQIDLDNMLLAIFPLSYDNSIYFFQDEDKHHPGPKSQCPLFHPKLVFSQIVLEQRPGVEKSFRGWFKPIYKDSTRLSPNQSCVFGIFHPELHKHVKNKDHVRSLYLSEGMSLEVAWQSGWFGGMFNLQGAVPLPRQTLPGAPQVRGCNWRLPLECQTASFCKRHREVE